MKKSLSEEVSQAFSGNSQIIFQRRGMLQSKRILYSGLAAPYLVIFRLLLFLLSSAHVFTLSPCATGIGP